jgi:hypothetical protein
MTLINKHQAEQTAKLDLMQKTMAELSTLVSAMPKHIGAQTEEQLTVKLTSLEASVCALRSQLNDINVTPAKPTAKKASVTVKAATEVISAMNEVFGEKSEASPNTTVMPPLSTSTKPATAKTGAAKPATAAKKTALGYFKDIGRSDLEGTLSKYFNADHLTRYHKWQAENGEKKTTNFWITKNGGATTIFKEMTSGNTVQYQAFMVAYKASSENVAEEVLKPEPNTD